MTLSTRHHSNML